MSETTGPDLWDRLDTILSTADTNQSAILAQEIRELFERELRQLRDAEITRLRDELDIMTKLRNGHRAMEGVGLRRIARRDVYLDRAKAEIDGLRERAEQAETAVKQHEDLLASIALYIKWHYVTKQLTTEQKDLFADAIERNAIRAHGPDGEEPDPEMAELPSYAPRWWRESHNDDLDQPAESKET